jgi:hypothetical protein
MKTLLTFTLLLILAGGHTQTVTFSRFITTTDRRPMQFGIEGQQFGAYCKLTHQDINTAGTEYHETVIGISKRVHSEVTVTFGGGWNKVIEFEPGYRQETSEAVAEFGIRYEAFRRGRFTASVQWGVNSGSGIYSGISLMFKVN